jgi:hypothetical protein
MGVMKPAESVPNVAFAWAQASPGIPILCIDKNFQAMRGRRMGWIWGSGQNRRHSGLSGADPFLTRAPPFCLQEWFARQPTDKPIMLRDLIVEQDEFQR